MFLACELPIEPKEAVIRVSLHMNSDVETHFSNWRTAGGILKNLLNRGRVFWIVEGFMTNWMSEEKTLLTKSLRRRYPDANVLVLNWYAHNSNSNTPQNVRVIGAILAFIIHQAGIASRSNIIGHSFGCHLAGEAGKVLISKYHEVLDEITGLDCAGPFFTGTSPLVKFDKSDARLTIAYHTNDNYSPFAGISTAFGNPEPNAATDVYFSKVDGFFTYGSCGSKQWTCTDFAGECDHSRAWHYLISAIDNENRSDCKVAIAQELIGSPGPHCSGTGNPNVTFRLPAFNQLRPMGVFFVDPGLNPPDFC